MAHGLILSSLIWGNMMKNAVTALLLVLGLSASTVSTADFYIGINHLNMNYDEGGFETLRPKAFNVRLGSHVNENLAHEFRLGSGTSKDTVRLDSVTEMELEIEQLMGVYGRLLLPVNERLAFYGLLGLTRAKLEARGIDMWAPSVVKVSDTETDISLGLGLDVMLGGSIFANVEYVLLQSDDAYDLDAVSLGLGYRF